MAEINLNEPSQMIWFNVRSEDDLKKQFKMITESYLFEVNTSAVREQLYYDCRSLFDRNGLNNLKFDVKLDGGDLEIVGVDKLSQLAINWLFS